MPNWGSYIPNWGYYIRLGIFFVSCLIKFTHILVICIFFTESAPRPIQSISCDVHCFSVCPLKAYFVYCLIILIYKVPRTKKMYHKKISWTKVKKGTWSPIFQFWLRNGLKLPCSEKFISGSQMPPHCAIILCIILAELQGCGCWR